MNRQMEEQTDDRKRITKYFSKVTPLQSTKSIFCFFERFPFLVLQTGSWPETGVQDENSFKIEIR